MTDQRSKDDGQAQQRNRMPEHVAAQLGIDGWERMPNERWRKSIGETEVHLRADAARSWMVTVESRGEVMRIAFHGSSFGSAVAEANRCYNLTKENQDQIVERMRQERLREHYGVESPGDHP